MGARVLIIGGGVSGLIANYVFRRVGATTTILEPGKPGGEFTAGGLKYIHKTDAMEAMFKDIDVPYSVYTVRGGILLRGQMYLYPECFADMKRSEAQRIQADHWKKTRRTEADGVHSKSAMNDPASMGPRRALRCDFQEMIDTLVGQATIIEAGLQKLDHRRNVAFDSKGNRHHYDFAVMTIPLWIIERACLFYVPEGATMRLNVIQVTPRRPAYAGFDYVYTPYTPGDVVHRFSPSQGGYSVEVNGELDHNGLVSDLNFIFADGYIIESIKEGLKGHLLPLKQPPDWPVNVAPIGRFSCWDSRMTTDVSLDASKELAQKWL